MSWFILAIIGHLSNGVAFAIDKILLKSAFSRSATYAGIVGLLSTVVALAVPFVSFWPSDFSHWLLAAVSGATFILAMWAFFAALARAEATRVVPIVGSLIPIFTLAGTFAFLAERLSDRTFLGFALLIAATIMLSVGKAGRPTQQTIWLAVCSAILFAVSSVAGKAVYEDSGFLGGFIATRLFAALTALLLLVVIDRQAGSEALSIVHPARRSGRSKHKQPGKMAAMLALVGQVMGAIGFVLVQWGVAQGSASLVNALQAVQYAFLVILALALRKRAPQLLGEHLDRKALAMKITALVVTAAGMYLLV